MSVNEKMTAIADAIRDKTGDTEPLTLDDMASKIYDVYNEGYIAGAGDSYYNGYSDAYDTFWYNVQHNPDGTDRTYYAPYLFSFNTFPAERFNPPYPILCTVKAAPSNGIPVASGNCMFRNYTDPKLQENPITEINVDITVTSGATYFFDFNLYLQKIQKVTVDAEQTLLNWFRCCYDLVYIRWGGEIGQDLDMSDCEKLDKDSISSTVNHLLKTASEKTLKLSLSAVDKAFETSLGAKDGSSSAEWIELITPYSNDYDGLWDIILE